MELKGNKFKIIGIWMIIALITGVLITLITDWEWYKCIIISVVCMGVNFSISEFILYLGILSKKVVDATRAKKI